MKMRVVKVVLRMGVLLALAGILAVNAGAGAGPVPYPTGSSCPSGPPCAQ